MSSRVDGLDAARGLALIGMFAAHVGDTGRRGSDADGWGWLVVFDGRASALFAVLAGVSMSLMLTGRGGAASAGAVAHTRARIAVRGGLLLVLGWMLAWLDTPVDVILDNLGIMFLLVLPALAWRPAVQAAAGAGVLVVGGPLLGWADPWLAPFDGPVIHELWSTHYPALVWSGYLLIGLAIGRWAPWRGPDLASLAGGGAMVAVGAYGLGLGLGGSWTDDAGVAWASVAPHSYTGFEMLGNVGVAAAVIGGCVAAASAAPRAIWPLASTGRMTLSLYVAHIVVIAIVGDAMVWEPSNLAWVVLTGAAVTAACVWRATLGQGPLERVLARTSSAVADSAVPRTPLGGAA
ncbi:heparan-alpha-glucosaminide N-acetyltransferase domain-containing protein [Demequina lignilytica]|uniref:Heparan-alpha-glucosaminide N-acetyltransferase domain-containing protein n=1 Tax=Demequina lignilytica TaxID=3051663 RepID=A0AB35MFJ2_9MICO|nr:heparan-alpha-glucosaminide N-acetyltransferase domain-containing protein [Demequina sp. SYSU T0a273]MDN4482522.1 heparan-alpha-glucosaminide N-acetyltransferase domain-containing protein [Demequina sp. SYSU T0a273]